MSILRLVLLAAVMAGCAIPPPGRPIRPAAGVKVPPGHMPPPGSCRVWFPGRPPGHQPPPGDCGRLQYQVPPGAVLIRG